MTKVVEYDIKIDGTSRYVDEYVVRRITRNALDQYEVIARCPDKENAEKLLTLVREHSI